ncbi:E3 ubiquitin/ISG15 ligase TRIM25-like [Archocentrus centrarchus]|uniref:E3 ubiquitin/ISG15 ligase TRIM25-like n=1 Tax=Archocentrus centrarchus TaxID=63155 RepID=UPI0011EA2EEB|nr:E3 ubiquitin/ISG15 ligase TRIM25-like [Archocentrus centrarchus]
MAERGLQLDQEKFCCSICLDLLNEPVTTSCGHSFCKGCIKKHWDAEDHRRAHSCPHCRQTFIQRPVLGKNTMLAELVEELNNSGLQAAPHPQHYAGPGDVACDVCTERKLKASKTCLQCVASYCELHLQPHYESLTFQKHRLVEASAKLQENICSHHNRVKEVFCRSDQQCVCYLCAMEEHKDHDTVSAAAERSERQRELGPRRKKLQQRIQDRENDMKLLQQQVEALSDSADRAVRDSQTMFSQLVRLIEKRSSDVKQHIRSQQKAEVSRAKEVQKKLQQEITELRRKDAELEQLSRTEDHGQFLLTYPSLSGLSESTRSAGINIQPQSYFEEVTAAVSELTKSLQSILSQDPSETSLTEGEALHGAEQHMTLMKQSFQPPEESKAFVKHQPHLVLPPPSLMQQQLCLVPPPPPPSFQPPAESKTLLKQLPCLVPSPPPSLQSSGEPTTRAEFLQYWKRITMDPNTVHRDLLLSKGNRKVTFGSTVTPNLAHPHRFTECHQVLSREALTGCCYWEVKWKRLVSVAVTYRCINRTGSDSEFGYNDKSWSLECDCNSYKFRHNSALTFLSVPQSSTVGVYLDHRAGVLSFYSVSETMTLIHRVRTTFTQPLHAGLWLDISGCAELVELQ